MVCQIHILQKRNNQKVIKMRCIKTKFIKIKSIKIKTAGTASSTLPCAQTLSFSVTIQQFSFSYFWLKHFWSKKSVFGPWWERCRRRRKFYGAVCSDSFFFSHETAIQFALEPQLVKEPILWLFWLWTVLNCLWYC